MVRQELDAVYEDGVFRPVESGRLDIPEGGRVRLVVDEEPKQRAESAEQMIRRWTEVYEGLSQEEINEIEKDILGNRFNIKRELEL